MTYDIYKALDICDKLSFFGGQRAGRELWFEKPVNVQNEDINNFIKDIGYLKEFISSQNAALDSLRFANKSLVKTNKIKRKELFEKATAEAIKEFVERLLKKSYIPSPYGINPVVDEYEIKVLAEKMTGNWND